MTELEKEIVEWHTKTFPDCSFTQQWEKFREELQELAQNDRDVMEIADLLIVLTVLKHRFGFNVDVFIKNKLEINKARKWKKDENVFKHVE